MFFFFLQKMLYIWNYNKITLDFKKDNIELQNQMTTIF